MDKWPTAPVSEITLIVAASLPDGYDDQRRSIAQELLAHRRAEREAKLAAWFQYCQGNYEQVAEKYKGEPDVIPLYTHPAPPSDYVLVPVEPTQDMSAAAWAAFERGEGLTGAWKAALAARPTP